jgi:hypothetical protein
LTKGIVNHGRSRGPRYLRGPRSAGNFFDFDQLDYALAEEASCVRICFIIFCIASMFPGERFSIHDS